MSRDSNPWPQETQRFFEEASILRVLSYKYKMAHPIACVASSFALLYLAAGVIWTLWHGFWGIPSFEDKEAFTPLQRGVMILLFINCHALLCRVVNYILCRLNGKSQGWNPRRNDECAGLDTHERESMIIVWLAFVIFFVVEVYG